MRELSEDEPRLRPRGGFTLIELLVALVLLDVGLLALVGLAAALARAADTDRAGFLATSVASARVERMASLPCAGAVANTETVGTAAVESYSDAPAPNGTRRLSDSVRVLTSGRPQVVVLTTGGRC